MPSKIPKQLEFCCGLYGYSLVCYPVCDRSKAPGKLKSQGQVY